MIVVYGYNAASHSLGVVLHSGSGGLCRGRRPSGIPPGDLVLRILGHGGGYVLMPRTCQSTQAQDSLHANRERSDATFAPADSTHGFW